MKSIALAIPGDFWEYQGTTWLCGKYNHTFPPMRFLAQPIGEHYQNLDRRLLIYFFFAASLVCGTFLALGLAGKPSFLIQHLTLVSTFSLYLACVFTGSHVLVDLIAARLPLGLAYGTRNVGKQWAVVFAGMALGMFIFQGTYQGLIEICGQSSFQRLPINLCVIPLCCTTAYADLAIVLLCHSSLSTTSAAHNQTQGVPLAAVSGLPGTSLAGNTQSAPKTKSNQISFSSNGLQVILSTNAISHVMVEDHYSRVFYNDGQGSREILVRESLKRLMSRIESADFLQTHRSYLVNKKQVLGYRKKGRSHWLVVGPGKTPLPISRRRQSEIKKEMATIVTS